MHNTLVIADAPAVLPAMECGRTIESRLEYAARNPMPDPASIVVSPALLTTAALLAVTLPSVFALYMVNKGEWTRADTSRFLYEIAWSWSWPALGFFVSAALGQAGASTGLLKAVATASARFAWLARLLEFVLVANGTMMLIAIALFVEAQIWFQC
ncbi:MAG: hypothetical protein HXY34_08595 [Candidatus Thorarchaeota archaeon]|nr:hypothetical protein [Candidatus Thorarchaeota archaeon]